MGRESLVSLVPYRPSPGTWLWKPMRETGSAPFEEDVVRREVVPDARADAVQLQVCEGLIRIAGERNEDFEERAEEHEAAGDGVAGRHVE